MENGTQYRKSGNQIFLFTLKKQDPTSDRATKKPALP